MARVSVPMADITPERIAEIREAGEVRRREDNPDTVREELLSALDAATARAEAAEKVSAAAISDQNELDAVVHFLGIESSDTEPVEACRALLASAEAAERRVAELTEWRDMSTAPRDGTRFMANQPPFGVSIVHRHDPGGEAKNPKHHYECWAFDSSIGPYPCKPTGWLPLPPGDKP